jgi:hypothetical protein
MPISGDALEALVQNLYRRPGHENVKAEIHRLLVEHFGLTPSEIYHEHRIEPRSRVDTLLGNTVFEIKRDLRNESADAKDQLARYLANREHVTREQYSGIATDGRCFEAFELREGNLRSLSRFEVNPAAPTALTIWLESILSLSQQLPAEPLTVISELGRESAAFRRAEGILQSAWDRVSRHPDISLKRELWNSHLQIVYGASQDDDGLWFQHSFLVIVAKAFAYNALDLEPNSAADLLAGDSLRRNGIQGTIESDFFDWVISDTEGRHLVNRIHSRVKRFQLSEVGTDLLKVLYESLIDPSQRHDLGEYYTPDWLARKLVVRHIDAPLTQHVLDPACGSGSFLFHAIRHIAAAARAQGYEDRDILELCLEHVKGIDVHPVAIIIARVTYLLSLGQQILSARHGQISIPIFLGDAMQWNVRPMMDKDEIVLRVPPAEPGADPKALAFPAAAIDEPQRFEKVLNTLVDASERDVSPGRLRRQLQRVVRVDEADLDTLERTYICLRDLQKAGRNHIWTFVARNMARPLWLSRRARVDRVIGNPPWLSFRYMTDEMKRKVREGLKGFDIWVGGKLATQQDLSAYFFARCVQLYLRREGRIAFLMPYAAMTRGQFQKFRTGRLSDANIVFDEAWTFDDRVFPLFPVPSCALFARRTAIARPLPEHVTAYAGILAHRNADEAEADRRLIAAEEDRPDQANFQAATPYRSAFRQGATLVPRMLCYVRRREAGFIGTGHRVPIESWRSRQEKQPWKSLPSITGYVEHEFLKVALLGESIAPYRILQLPEAVIPYENGLLTAEEAFDRGYSGLADWLEQACNIWSANKRNDINLLEQINYYNKLSAQFRADNLRIIYTKAGTRVSSVVVKKPDILFDHKLYWSNIKSIDEGRYLSAILNSEVTRNAIQNLQSRGQWGARDFDKVFFTLPIAPFNSHKTLHQDLADTAAHAEWVAASVPLSGDESSTLARRKIRAALLDDGVSRDINDLVSRLLFGEPAAVA